MDRHYAGSDNETAIVRSSNKLSCNFLEKECKRIAYVIPNRLFDSELLAHDIAGLAD
jgi:hypothetical protein